MNSDRQSADQARVLAAIYSRAVAAPGEEIEVQPLIPGLRMPRRLVYSAVLALVDAGLLEYIGAGPRVHLTPLGHSYSEELLPHTRDPSANPLPDA